MPDPALFWHNPTAVRIVALLAVGLLVTTIWLFRRQKRSGRGAAIVCLMVSIALHVALIAFVPQLTQMFSGSGPTNTEVTPGTDSMSVAVFAPDFDDDQSLAEQLAMPLEESNEYASTVEPLSLPEPLAALSMPAIAEVKPSESLPNPQSALSSLVPAALASASSEPDSDRTTDMDDLLGDWLAETLDPPEVTQPTESSSDIDDENVMAASSTPQPASRGPEVPSSEQDSSKPRAGSAHEVDGGPDDDGAVVVDGAPVVDEDFASRLGASKTIALQETGGDANTEAAVAAALRFLCSNQRADGAWDPLATGAGRERAPLGLTRGSAGRRAETGLTGLALLSLLGSGHTHQDGEYQQNVYRGLTYLLGRQRSDGSLAGDASVYAAHYCHAMASLAIAEAAALTGDPAAKEATRRAVAYSKSTQHPATGGWRYTRGDRGDLSQLGWQAMVIDAAVRSGAIQRPTGMQNGVARFLDSVRMGSAGGLATYRPGEGPTPTMTAEALATRLLIGQKVPAATIQEAEAVLMSELPGKANGADNYYYWYYATIALHQLQDDAWRRWNTALKQRLLSTQRSNGSWSDSTLWGGYGGTVYSTSMATLCLESYYRHDRRTE